MTGPGWSAEPLSWSVDLAHGGRWTSLRTPSREWLWTRPDPSVQDERSAAQPGQGFVDAGGGEECVPTVRGEPDHGSAWSQPWSGQPGTASVDLEGIGRLSRRITGGGGVDLSSSAIEVEYTFVGRPGAHLLHAVHLLLDLGPAAWVEVPGVGRAIDLDADGPAAMRAWPGGLDRLGPDDGSAACFLLPGCRRAVVLDGDHALALQWECPDAPELCSLLVWRNLRGWPAENPYRSVGIEPLLGRAADRDAADPADCARLDASGRLRWQLRLTALRRLR